jgi:sarcosine oxidase subunit gamma
VDVSAQRTTLLLGGSRVRDVLAHGCSLDLHPSRFPAGACAQTMLAHAPVILLALPAGEFWVLVRASFAAYLADWLFDATLEDRHEDRLEQR